MDERLKILFYQYFLGKGDILVDNRKTAFYHLCKNKFKYDYDLLTAYKAILYEDFFDEIMKDLFNILDL